ncbi:Mss4-like protein [Annulohypoxylon truncatum]|uniref:Mss4-like protein n=1 Tax=Annulohypoxylon truncatum TaxID=327061 RepID=UPI0020083ECC|nr:Mss4-like protein [Annulohypoxylon truncatum]KAI1211451.1 Mss4-like protein [Annulohypoxylon truncatum]
MAATVDKSKQYFPLAGSASDGWSTETEATATCFCGAVQLAFPLQKPGLIDTFVCHCSDCHKITASMFASNFIVADAYLRHLRGRETLKQFGQSKTIASGHRMTNHFCGACGTLMYRVGAQWPGASILRIGTVDDFSLQDTVLRPRVEQFVEERMSWLGEVKGAAERVEGMAKFG